MSYPSDWKATGHGSWRWLHEKEVQCVWRDAVGRQCRRAFAGTEQEAAAFLASKWAARSREPLGLPVDVTWQDALDMYRQRLTVRKNGVAYIAGTLALLDDLRQRCGCALQSVTALHIDGWLAWLAAAGQADDRPGWAATCNRKRVQVGSFFRWLFKRRLVVANPVDATDPFRVEKRIRHVLSPGEYAKLLRQSEQAIADLFDFLLYTGVRIGEAAAMRRDDVKGGVWLIPKRKGHNQLTIPLVGELGQLVARQPLYPDGLVWHRCTGKLPGRPISAGYVRFLLRPRCKRAGIPMMSAHGFRHALASWADTAGIGRDAIQHALGHDAGATTALYMHGDHQAVVAQLQDVIVKMRHEAVAKLA